MHGLATNGLCGLQHGLCASTAEPPGGMHTDSLFCGPSTGVASCKTGPVHWFHLATGLSPSRRHMCPWAACSGFRG